jgi:hypothetical protein
MNKKVLLIVPEFPPNNSIGGRRWAKFAKYLAKDNINVFVIAFKPTSYAVNSNWLNDISNDKIKVFYLSSRYPKILESSSKNLVIRIIKKVLSIIVSFIDGGIIQDRAIFFRSNLLNCATKLIQENNIKNVICSGPYHRASYYTSLLKNDFPNINFIVDFRDRWTDGQVYGIDKVSDAIYRKEEGMQKYTCEKADFVISTYEQILDELKALYPYLDDTKFLHFSHNYDPSDYPTIIGFSSSVSQKQIRFIYGGTINTAALIDGFIPFLNALKSLQLERNDLYQLISFEIYGSNFRINELIEHLNISSCVKILPKISEYEFYKKVNETDFPMIFLGNKWKNLLTTKSIAYLPFRKPILVVAEKGKVTDMVLNNLIGYHFSPDKCYQNLVTLVEDYKMNQIHFNNDYDYEAYSYEFAAKRLIQLLK